MSKISLTFFFNVTEVYIEYQFKDLFFVIKVSMHFSFKFWNISFDL